MMFWINNPFDPLPLEGGRPLRYFLLARELVKAGHEVVWWSSDFHHLQKKRRNLKNDYDYDGFQIRLVPTLSYQRNVSWRRWRSHIQYAKTWGGMAEGAIASGQLRSPDAVLISMPPLGLYPVAWRICGSVGSKLFVDIQDAWPETFYQLLPRIPHFLKAMLFAPLHRMANKAYRGADFLSAVSNGYVNHAKQSGCCVETKVFPLGAPAVTTAGQAQRVQDDHELKLVYIGNLGISYDLKTMIKGVLDLHDSGLEVCLDVAGDGSQAGYVKHVAEQDGSPVKYLGYLSEQDMSALLCEGHVGVVPMKPESLVAVPNKLIDYASRGLAVISSLEGELQDLLDEYQAGISYEFGSRRSFADAVSTYYHDRILLGSHMNNSFEMFKDKFDASIIYPAMAEWIIKCTRH